MMMDTTMVRETTIGKQNNNDEKDNNDDINNNDVEPKVWVFFEDNVSKCVKIYLEIDNFGNSAINYVRCYMTIIGYMCVYVI